MKKSTTTKKHSAPRRDLEEHRRARLRRASAVDIAGRMIQSYTSIHDVHDIIEFCSSDFETLINTIAMKDGQSEFSRNELGKLEERITAALPTELHSTFVEVCDRYGEDSLHYAQAGFLLGLAVRGAR
jgi:hypothetical protein